MSSFSELDRAAENAVQKHWRLQNEKTLDLVLGNMVAMDGIAAVRRKLQWHLDHLAEFDPTVPDDVPPAPSRKPR